MTTTIYHGGSGAGPIIAGITDPPFVTAQNPAAAAVDVARQTNPSFSIRDNNVAVVLSTVEVWVNGTKVYTGAAFETGWTDSTVAVNAFNGYDFTLDPDLLRRWIQGETVTIQVYAENNLALSVDESWSFYIKECAEVVDRLGDAWDLLPRQFQNSTNLKNLLKAFIGEPDCVTWGTQELENVFQELLLDRWIETSEGEQLDSLGEILGRIREYSDDEVYRQFLKIKARINVSKGEAERLIQIAVDISAPQFAEYRERWPAFVILYLHGMVGAAGLGDVQLAAGAGIGVLLVGSHSTTPFVFGKDQDTAGAVYGEELPYGEGFNEYTMDIGGYFSDAYVEN